MMSVGQKVYSQPGAEGAAAGWTEEAKKDDDWVQDAEVETDDKDEGKDNTTRV
jgi:hypothetical protein